MFPFYIKKADGKRIVSSELKAGFVLNRGADMTNYTQNDLNKYFHGLRMLNNEKSTYLTWAIVVWNSMTAMPTQIS